MDARTLLVVLAAVLLGGVSCGPERQPLLDLVALFDVARVEVETSTIEFATPEGRRHLIKGWSLTRPKQGNGSFVWTEGDRASLWFQVGAVRDLKLELVCRRFRYPGAPRQYIDLFLSGRPLGRLPLWARSTEAIITVPASLVRLGANRLELRTAWQQRPREVLPGSKDGLLRSIACQSLKIEGAASTPDPEAIRVEGDPRLRLPRRSQLSYFVRPPPGSALRFDAVRGFGSGADGRLEVSIRLANDLHVRSWSFPVSEADGEPVVVELLAAENQPVEIVFRAPSVNVSAAGVEVVRPVIIGITEVDSLKQVRVEAGQSARPNIIVYLVDSLRRDRLGLYGYERNTTPNIDAFGAEATVFDRALAQSPWTRPSVASLFTGLDPPGHGVQRPNQGLPADLPGLPGLLQQAGYQTFGIVTNGNVSEAFGFDRDFDSFRYLNRVRPPDFYELSNRVNFVALRWLEQRDPDRPFFLYLHTSDPHAPYTPHEPFRKRFAPDVDDPSIGTLLHTNKMKHDGGGPRDVRNLSNLYDAEIAYNDEHFGRLLKRLRALGLYQSSLIVFLADHGEAFKEHGTWQHGTTLYEEEIAIPLIIKFPDGRQAGTRVQALARQVDVLPTLLEFLGLDAPERLDGRSLLPAIAAKAEAPVFAYSYLARRRGSWVGVVHEDHKLVRAREHEGGGTREWLFDLASDPAESDDLLHDLPVWHGFLSNRLDRAITEAPAGSSAPTPDLDPELRKRLEMLGYL